MWIWLLFWLPFQLDAVVESPCIFFCSSRFHWQYWHETLIPSVTVSICPQRSIRDTGVSTLSPCGKTMRMPSQWPRRVNQAPTLAGVDQRHDNTSRKPIRSMWVPVMPAPCFYIMSWHQLTFILQSSYSLHVLFQITCDYVCFFPIQCKQCYLLNYCDSYTK